jgi:hypothetical protein
MEPSLAAAPAQIRGHNRRLILHDLTYQDQGRYRCEAANTVAGERQLVKSSPIQVEVRGRPAVDTSSSSNSLALLTGHDAVLEVRFCADPRPEVTWHLLGDSAISSGELLAGGEPGLLEGVRAGELVADGPDCYRTSLLVESAGPHLDSRAYLMRAANQHGEERHTVQLRVGAGLAQETLIGGLVGGGLCLLVLVLVVVFSCRRCCFCCQSKEKKLKQQPDLER